MPPGPARIIVDGRGHLAAVSRRTLDDVVCRGGVGARTVGVGHDDTVCQRAMS
jgi:hypothetical protein